VEGSGNVQNAALDVSTTGMAAGDYILEVSGATDCWQAEDSGLLVFFDYRNFTFSHFPIFTLIELLSIKPLFSLNKLTILQRKLTDYESFNA